MTSAPNPPSSRPILVRWKTRVRDLFFQVWMSNCWPVPATMLMVTRHPSGFSVSLWRMSKLFPVLWGVLRQTAMTRVMFSAGILIIWWESESLYMRDVRLAGLVEGMTATARTPFVGINARGVTKDYIRFPTLKPPQGEMWVKYKRTSSENHLHLPRNKSGRCPPQREIKTVKSRQINCLK